MGDVRRGERAATVRAWGFATIIGIAIGAAMGASLASLPLGIALGLCFAVVFAVAFQPSVDMDPGEAVPSGPAPAAAAPIIGEPADQRLILGEAHVVDGDGGAGAAGRSDTDPDRYDGD